MNIVIDVQVYTDDGSADGSDKYQVILFVDVQFKRCGARRCLDLFTCYPPLAINFNRNLIKYRELIPRFVDVQFKRLEARRCLDLIHLLA